MSKWDDLYLTDEEKKKCHAIIHGASGSIAAIAAASAQIPLSDTVAITPIQIGMIIALGKVFNKSVTKAGATAILGSATAMLVGRGATQVLWGWVPFLGNAINTATATGVTEAIGWKAVKHFVSMPDAEIIHRISENAEDQEVSEKEGVEDQAYALIASAMDFTSGNKSIQENMTEYEELKEKFRILREVEKYSDPAFKRTEQNLIALELELD